jgi:thioredoxin-disulfide reductase
MYDIVIVGGGPAGITAGIYAARKKLNALLVCKDFIGQVGQAFFVENYPGFEGISGQELMKKFKNHLKKFEIDIKEGEKVENIFKKEDGSFEIITFEKNKYYSRAVIVASGIPPKSLNAPGEKEFIGKGVSYCTTCDAPLFNGKDVAVIGGGNSALEAVIELSKYCSKIYILDNKKDFKADEIIIQKVKKIKKVQILLNSGIEEIKGKKFVESMTYKDLETGKLESLSVQGIFVQIGMVSATIFLKGLVDFNEKGEIKIDPITHQTKTEGIFAAGDITDIPSKQIIIAAGEGAKAALSAYSYIKSL